MKLVKSGDNYIELLPNMATRHGLVTGATGSGKTVTIKLIAEHFSKLGVPVFMQDVKGDLSGFVEAGASSEKFLKHIAKYNGEEPNYQAFPTSFWDIYGKNGHPLRTTVSEMGPMMLAKLLDLNDTQMGVLYSIFKIADDNGLLLLDYKDLDALINHVSTNAGDYKQDYGNMHPSTIGAIKRKLMMLEADGLSLLFGEPALDIDDFIKCDENGNGIINVLNAEEISKSPSTYASFLLWLLSEIFEELPEVGDVDKPKLVFFFDEAHMLFDGMPDYLMEKVEQVIKLIRSKGVGIFFITQNPADIPDSVLSQLGNRIQHVLRAYTPKEQKAVRIAAQTFRENPEFKTEDVITQLGVGEALISFLNNDGVPQMVQRGFMLAPMSKIGPTSENNLKKVMLNDKVGVKYDDIVDRESAFEILKKRADKIDKGQAHTKEEMRKRSTVQKKKATKKRSDSPFDKFLKSASTAIGSQLGRSLVRGILGSLTRK